MQIYVTIKAGICGMETEIIMKGSMEGDYQIELISDCPLVQGLEPELQEVDLLMGAVGRYSQNPVFKAAELSRLHAACPVPTGIIKAFEVFCGLALPADVKIAMEKRD